MFIFTFEDLIKIVLAMVIGSIIGMERELHSKAAGLRTITLITVGATLFMIISAKLHDDRVAAGIVSGVGFLGAGVILFAEGKLKGLTTAASIWVAAALGMCIGQGEYVLAFSVAVAVVIVLVLFARLDHWIDGISREARIYEVTYEGDKDKHKELENLFQKTGMHIRGIKRLKQGKDLISVFETEAFTREHEALAEKLLEDREVKDLKF
jgi:putative Mg2+ transporter-C (MgtC) family protein